MNRIGDHSLTCIDGWIRSCNSHSNSGMKKTCPCILGPRVGNDVGATWWLTFSPSCDFWLLRGLIISEVVGTYAGHPKKK